MFAASAFDVAAADQTPGIGKEDNLEQHGGGVGGSAGFIVAVMAVEGGDFGGHVGVDEVVEGVFEGAGLQLLFEDNGEKTRAVINGLVVSHEVR